jgi:hypothetical protein
LLRAACFLGAQVLLQGRLGQAAHLAKEIQLVGHAQAGRVLAAQLPLTTALAAGAQIVRRAGGVLAAGRVHAGHERGALDAVLRARLLDIERRDAQVAVVGQRQRDHFAQTLVGKVVAPGDVRGGLGVRRHLGRLVGVALRPACRHRRGRTFIHRGQAACAEQGCGGQGK